MKSLQLLRTRVLLSIIFILLAAALSAVPNPGGWEQFQLKDAVHTMTVSGGIYYEPTTYEFTNEGMLLSESSPSSSFHYEYEQDAAYNVSAMIRMNGDERLQITRFEYNGKGGLVKAIVTSGDGAVLPREEYYFNGTGRLTEMRFVTFMRDNNCKYTYSYNAAGQMIREDLYLGDGSHEGWTTYSYDANGSVRQEKSYFNATDPPRVIDYEHSYDDCGNITRTLKTENGDSTYQTVTEYSYSYFEVLDGSDW